MKAIFKLLILANLFSLTGKAQIITVTEMAAMPEGVSNNAVTMATVNGVEHLYSFGGIDNSKIYSGIHLKSFRYNTLSDVWEQIQNLPDNSGKIASSASNVKNIIYIIGGYHVASNGTETSSNKVHIYDPESNTFLADGANSLLPIDDQVQTVWRDSLIYVITGWSNTTNVPNVQIYNPVLNQWSAGTSVPNSNIYKAFGANGCIIGDTIYYYGGASTASNFPAQKYLRKGVIDQAYPINITWSQPVIIENMYRGVVTTDGENGIYFLGGSPISYNYNGIAYNGSGGVEPNSNFYFADAQNLPNWYTSPKNLPMDLRGIGEYSTNIKYLAGGMESGQQVSNKTLRLEINSVLDIEANLSKDTIVFYPNPYTNEIQLYSGSTDLAQATFTVYNTIGNILFVCNHLTLSEELKQLHPGHYLIQITKREVVSFKRVTKL